MRFQVSNNNLVAALGGVAQKSGCSAHLHQRIKKRPGAILSDLKARAGVIEIGAAGTMATSNGRRHEDE
jgi:hypothetical protein